MSTSPFAPSGTEIAVVVYTKGDPIHVDSNKIASALSFMGFSTHVIEVDWASPAEWDRVIDPMRTRQSGRHSDVCPDPQAEYIVRWYRDFRYQQFVRDYGDGYELEELI